MLVIVFHNRVTCSFTASLNGARTSSILPSIFCPSVISSHALLFFFFHKQLDRESALIGGEPHRRMWLDRTLGTARTVAICIPVLRSADVALRRYSMDREEEQPHRETEWWNPQKWVSNDGDSVRYFRHFFGMELNWKLTDSSQSLRLSVGTVQKSEIIIKNEVKNKSSASCIIKYSEVF